MSEGAFFEFFPPSLPRDWNQKKAKEGKKTPLTQILLISGVALGSPITPQSLPMNLSCLAASNDRNRSPGCWKLFSFTITARSRLPEKGIGFVGVRAALRTGSILEGK